MTVKHWLEAIVGNDTRFRVICEDYVKCSKENKDYPGCYFEDQFKEFGVDMIEWGVADKEDVIIGRIELLPGGIPGTEHHP